MNNDGLGIVYLFVFIIGALIFFIPTFISRSRNHENKGWVLLLNILIGLSGIGWIAVLLWAALGQKTTEARD